MTNINIIHNMIIFSFQSFNILKFSFSNSTTNLNFNICKSIRIRF